MAIMMTKESLILICKKHAITEFKYRGIKRPKLTCKKCEYEAGRKYLRDLKQKAVNHKGGACQHCGYNKSLRSLVFHHINPEYKDFAIGENRPGVKKARTWAVIVSELDKCILLCQNCHNEVHEMLDEEKKNYPLYDLPIHRKDSHHINNSILKGRSTPELEMIKINNGHYNKHIQLTAGEIKHQKWLERNKS